MPLGRQSSLVIGAVAAVVMSGALAVLAMAPQLTPLRTASSVPAIGAWVWTPRSGSMNLVPFAAPLSMPFLRRAAEGYVYAQQDTGDIVPQRFDPDAARFVTSLDRLNVERAPESGTGETTVPLTGERAGWLFTTSYNGKTRILRAGATSADHAVAGPTIPVSWDPAFALTLEGGRLVVVAGWKIFVAREGDAVFTEVQPRPELPKNLVGAAPAGGARVILVTSGSQQGGGFVPGQNILATRLVDVDTGAATPGPPLPGPLAGKSLEPIRSASLDDGTLLLVASEEKATSRWNRPALPVPASALCVLLACAGAFGWACARRHVVVDRAVHGLVIGGTVCAGLLMMLFVLGLLGMPAR